jgi:hypothetical protein
MIIDRKIAEHAGDRKKYVEYVDEFQDRLMFGTDSCLRSDLARPNKQVLYIKKLKEKK